MKKTVLVILAILVAVLVYFFFPKDGGSTCGFCPGPPHIHRTEYGCIGFKYDYQPMCIDCGTQILCFGIVTSDKKCYTYLHGLKEEAVEVPNCKNPETWEEILSICPNCYFQASTAAYSQNDLIKAIEICNSGDTLKHKDECVLGIAGVALYKNNLEDAENICYNYLVDSKEICLRELAEKIAEFDVDEGENACGKIQTVRIRDNCYHNIAVIARQTNETRALELCEMMSSRVEDCKDLIINYCTIYPC